MTWDRVRFYANLEDYRPVKWPPPGPYWCSGESDTHSIVVAYIPHNDSELNTISIIKEFWPEADAIWFTHTATKLEFSDRFAEPEWWRELKTKNEKPGPSKK